MNAHFRAVSYYWNDVLHRMSILELTPILISRFHIQPSAILRPSAYFLFEHMSLVEQDIRLEIIKIFRLNSRMLCTIQIESLLQ